MIIISENKCLFNGGNGIDEEIDICLPHGKLSPGFSTDVWGRSDEFVLVSLLHTVLATVCPFYHLFWGEKSKGEQKGKSVASKLGVC